VAYSDAITALLIFNSKVITFAHLFTADDALAAPRAAPHPLTFLS